MYTLASLVELLLVGASQEACKHPQSHTVYRASAQVYRRYTQGLTQDWYLK
jgi:hypothetical protein